jgi:hypothetical protein
MTLQAAGEATALQARASTMRTWPACRGGFDERQTLGRVTDAVDPLAQPARSDLDSGAADRQANNASKRRLCIVTPA